MLTGHEHLRGAFPRQLVQSRQLPPESFIRGLQALALGRDVPQLQISVVAAQSPRERVLRRVIEDQQPQPSGKPEATGLTLADRVPEESGRSHAGRLKRDDARNQQQPARVVFACEVLEATGKEQYAKDIVRRFGHCKGGLVVSHAGAMSARSILRIRCIARPRRYR